jgi:hypothetical protein
MTLGSSASNTHISPLTSRRWICREMSERRNALGVAADRLQRPAHLKKDIWLV